MEWINLVMLQLLQGLAGLGLLSLLQLRFKLPVALSLAMLSGLAIFSFMPFVLQLVFIPINKVTVFTSLLLVTVILNTRSLGTYKYYRNEFRLPRIFVYELPMFTVVAALVFISAWRCYYYPPTPRDLTSGAEVLAQYAVGEQSMINSVFSVNLRSTNNPYKPPFITCLQIIYKLAGFPFGQLWLSSMFISFVILLFHLLRTYVPNILAWCFLIIFLAIPEMYAYTYIPLYDYANAVFFFTSVYYLVQFVLGSNKKELLFAAICMGMATYIRSETIIIAFFLTPLITFVAQPHGWKTKLYNCATFMAPALVVFVITIKIYNGLYLPQQYNVSAEVNKHLYNLTPLWQRFHDIFAELLFSKQGLEWFGYLPYLFVLCVVASLLWGKYMGRLEHIVLATIFLTCLAIAFVGYLLPLMDLYSSTKRALFKLFPLMIWYMTSCSVIQAVNRRIRAKHNNKQL